MGSHLFQEDISLEPLKRDVLNYKREYLRKDLFAGFSVALLSIPQAVAYSLLAGLPPICGILAVIFGTALAALIGSSRHLIMGPSNAVALLVQSATAEILYSYFPYLEGAARQQAAIQIITSLTFLIGLFQILGALLKLGRLVPFVSQSVVVGYVAGSSMALMINQAFVLLGIEGPSNAKSVYEKAIYFMTHLDHIQWFTAAIGLSSFFLLTLLKRLKPHWPVYLVTIASVSIFVFIMGKTPLADKTVSSLMLLKDTGHVEDNLITLHFPLFDIRTLNALLPYAFAIALFGILEMSSVAKSLAAKSGQRILTNHEMFSLGFSNLALSFLGSMPCSGSTSRTALNFSSGAATRFSAVFSALIVALLVFPLGDLVDLVPLTTLAALLIATAFTIIDPEQLKLCARATRSDAFVLLTTSIACIFFNLDLAFYVGVVLSITLHLRKAASPFVREYCYQPATGELKPYLETNWEEGKKIRVIDIEGELFFGAVDLFQSTLKTLAEDTEELKVIILRLKHVRDLDATACLALKHLHDYLKRTGRHLIGASIPDHVWKVMRNSGLVQAIGNENLFRFDERAPHISMQQAYARARKLVNQTKEEELPSLDPALLHVQEHMLNSEMTYFDRMFEKCIRTFTNRLF